MRIFRLVLGLLALTAAPLPAAAQGFLSAVEDLPLAPGLIESPEAALTFDTQSGRIVEGAAHGPVTAARVLDFYRTTLPQLGWVPESDTRFRRETEILRLEPVEDGRTLVLRFTLSPE